MIVRDPMSAIGPKLTASSSGRNTLSTKEREMLFARFISPYEKRGDNDCGTCVSNDLHGLACA
jgi:hypothetical protein